MLKMRQSVGLGAGLMLAWGGAGCSGKATLAADSAGAGGSAEAGAGSRAAGGSGQAAAGTAGNLPAAGNAGPSASGTSAAGASSSGTNGAGAGASASAAGGAATSAGGMGGAGSNTGAAGGAGTSSGGTGGAGLFAPGTPLTPRDGWIAAESNALLIRGAVYPFADSASKLAMATNFTGSNACIQGSAVKIDLTCTPVAPATDCYGMFFGAAIGLNLNQPIDPLTMMPGEPASYNAGLLRGFAFDLTGSKVPSPKELRFQVETSSQVFCNSSRVKLKTGTNLMLFSDLVTECFRTPNDPDLRPTAETAKSLLVKISWHVLTNIDDEVPYDFCVSNIQALRK